MYAGTRLRVCPCVHVCVHVYCVNACVCMCAPCAHCACLSMCAYVCTCPCVRMCLHVCACVSVLVPVCACTQEWTCVLCACVYTPVHGCAGESRSENPILTHVQLHTSRVVCAWPPPCLRRASQPCFRLGDRGAPHEAGTVDKPLCSHVVALLPDGATNLQPHVLRELPHPQHTRTEVCTAHTYMRTWHSIHRGTCTHHTHAYHVYVRACTRHTYTYTCVHTCTYE